MFKSLPDTVSGSVQSAQDYNNFGMPVTTPCIYEQYQNGGYSGPLNACALITDGKRTTAFYESHGFAFSASGIINFSTERTSPFAQVEVEIDDGKSGGGKNATSGTVTQEQTTTPKVS